MLVEIIIFVAGIIAAAITIKVIKARKIKIPSIIPVISIMPTAHSWGGMPIEIEVEKSISDKGMWICQQGIKMLSGWNNMPNINVKFCRPETMPNGGQVSGVFYFETPDTIYINDNISGQSWLMAKVILHELYHLYQVNVFGTTSDTDETVNRWSDQVMDRILYDDFYKDNKGMVVDAKAVRFTGTFSQVKNNNFIGTIWSKK